MEQGMSYLTIVTLVVYCMNFIFVLVAPFEDVRKRVYWFSALAGWLCAISVIITQGR